MISFFITEKEEIENGTVFKLNEWGTSVRVEFIAGMTTFFAMVYILMVNANMFADPFGDGSNPLGVSYGAIYIATAIAATIGALCDTSTVTTFSEVNAGGRTGLTSVFCGLGFFIAMLLLTH